MTDRLSLFRKSVSPVSRISALCIVLFGLQFAAWAQTTNTITSASFSSLQTAMNQGVPTVVVLAFDSTISMTSVIEVTSDTTLDATGHNVVLAGGSTGGVFLVDEGVTFKMINVTISGGQNIGADGTNGVAGTSSGSRGNNGGVGGLGTPIQGGAINTAGNSLFINCIFLTNTATGGAGGVGGAGGNGSVQAGNGGNGGAGGVGFGGAIYNDKPGNLVLSNCTFSGNIAVGGAGGVGGANGGGATAFPGNGGAGAVGQGGALYNLGLASIINCAFYDNLAEGGNSQAAQQPLSNGDGGKGPAGPVGEGGAIFNLGTNTILNTTFYQNFAAGGGGGNGGNAKSTGFYAGLGGNGGNAYGGSVYNGSNALFFVTNCTFSAGVVVGGTNGTTGTGPFTNGTSALGAGFGAHIANVGGTFGLKNSILASPTNAANAFGLLTNSDLGNNLSSDSTPALNGINSSNLTNPKFLTGIISSNGGPTLTIALRFGSPAIDAITDGSAPAFDQRGAARSGLADIGAFEFNGAFSSLFTVSGQVTMGTNPFPGVTVSASTSSTTTDANGNYSLLLPSGTYAVSPQPSAFFTPGGSQVNLNNSNNVGGINFKATNVFTGFSMSTNTNSVVTLTITNFTIPNHSFITRWRTNLAGGPTNWIPVATNNSGINGVFTFSFNTTNAPQGFFSTVPGP